MKDYLDEVIVPLLSCLVICFYVAVFAVALNVVAGR